MRFSKTGFKLVASDDPTKLTNPNISDRFLLRQFWCDIFGKEVQSAATYSYMWLADQVGHIFLGLLFNFIGTFALAYIFSAAWSKISGLLVAFAVASVWEFLAYRADVKQVTHCFPLDEPLLRRNAIAAASYMWMGAVVGFGFQQSWPWNVLLFLAMLCVAIFFARSWLRQKIIWQKAALPYLFRLADAKPTVDKKDADALQRLIDEGVPPSVRPRQVIIGGPIGSGRTSLATGIGTEFALKSAKVRYLSFDTLLEFAATTDKNPPPPPRYGNDPGPRNISYWPWNEAQVLIIDDLGPVISSQYNQPHPQHFESILKRELGSIAPDLSQQHTIWICGDLGGRRSTVATNALDDFTAAVAELCGSKQGEQLVIKLQAGT